tara:strand:+ start:831 stop:1823 length:993 start_codon:yes stop_codon:yes gene_type:complete
VLYRTLGSTGLKVSEIAFGCGSVGGLMTDNDRTDEHLEVIRRALERGFTHFDTAYSYGDGKSEANLGRVLGELGPEITLSTKVRPGPERPLDLKAATIDSVERSLERLRRDSVDIIQLHDHVAPADGDCPHFSLSPGDVLGPGGVVEGFEELRERGRVRFFGFTGLGQSDSLHELVESERFHTVQVYFNLLNPTAAYSAPEGFKAQDFGLLLNKAAGRGMGTFAIRVLARGALTPSPRTGEKEPRALSPGSGYFRDIERARKLDWLSEEAGGPINQAAFRFALMRPEFSTVLAGCASVGEVDETAVCSGVAGLSDEALARLKALWKSDFA